MKTPDSLNTNELLKTTVKEIKNGNTSALKTIFDLYAKKLFYFTLKFVSDTMIAEEIVQDVFIAVWKNRNELNIQHSFEAYLYTSVKNRSMSYLRQKISSPELQDISIVENSMDNSTRENSAEYTDLKNEIYRAINELPERCRIIFNLSRNSGLTYKQIANELNISTESVKTQIGIALKKMKAHLKKSGF